MAFKIEKDKKKHFWVGIPLGLFIQYMLSYFFPAEPFLTTGLNLVVLAAGCYGFELFSLVTGKGHADNLDAIAGILGGIAGILVYWIVHIFL